MTIGNLGELFTALAMASATTATFSFFFADRNQHLAQEKTAWEKIAIPSFYLHVFSILGIVATLFYMIYQHDYRYFYVWDHSSNELPVYYMIACFWEGQEGSFLLWMFWHGILGLFLIRNKTEWRNLTMAIVSSVQVILVTMILGTYFGENWVKFIMFVGILLPSISFANQVFFQKNKDLNALPFQGTFHLASLILPFFTLLLMFRSQTGFYENWTFGLTGANLLFSVFILVVIAYGIFTGFFVAKYKTEKQYYYPMFAAGATLTLAAAAAIFEISDWKLGSTPFIELKIAKALDPIYKENPNFVPSNGSGLNALLQNYWMVIHPPTLFLGFASTLIPFAFVIAGLIKGKYDEWIKPSRPWLIFSTMILGVGIIMGGYWAYETLNFGGYWNWDPVENASFVPWLTAIAALHTLLIYQKNKTSLKLSQILVVATFLLVLYSTFLTRSGILGETSVHTFTDLGLSGQLLLLVFFYLVPVILLFSLRWKDIPSKEGEVSFWTAENFLLLGALVFIFAAIEIAGTTSLPVFNKIFGTHIAPPPKLLFFYYQWNVWFAILFGIISGIGQFLWWNKVKEQKLSDAIFRPFLVAVISSCILLVLMAMKGMDFVHEKNVGSMIGTENLGRNVFSYIGYGILFFADEILLFSSIFAILANLDLLIGLIRKNSKGLKVMGGTVTHIGFAMMLLGILYSAGYDKVVSKNLTPAELNGFDEDEKNDNVLLPLNAKRQVPGYFVTYKGRLEAESPIEKVAVIEENAQMLKVKFKDKKGETFALPLPRNMFLEKKGNEETPVHTMANTQKLEGNVDLKYVKDFIEKNLQDLKPKLINNRTIYQIEFVDMKDTTNRFILYPESEVNEDMGGITSHPSRKIFAAKDIYTFVSSVPNPKDVEPQYRHHNFETKPCDSTGCDTLTLGAAKFLVRNVIDLSAHPEAKKLIVAAGANIEVFANGKKYNAQPVFTVDQKRTPGMITSDVQELGLTFAFVNVQPESRQISIQVQEKTNAGNDYVVLKALEKPYINFLWLGTFILTAGFGIAIYRRVKERNAA
ncbi:MAG: cytochrome c biogenesis protein CcsA [Bacteroidia bacterium]